MNTEIFSEDEIQNQNYEVPLEHALELAKGHHQSGNYVIAERTYRDILRAVPGHFPTTQLLGALLFQNGYFEEARTFFVESLENNPEDPGCLNNCAGVALQLGEYGAAEEYLKRALEINPDFVDALSNMTYACWQLKKYAETEEYCKRLLAIQPENTNALNSLAISYSRRFRYEESFDMWEKAQKIDPENAVCISNWGNALRDMGRIAEARLKCEEAYNIDKEDPIVVMNYASTLRDTGDLKKAIEMFREATNVQPDFPQAHAGLAVALNDEGRFKEAAVAARYAIAFDRTLPHAYNALSTAEYSLGNLSQAHLASQMAVHYSDKEAADPYITLAEVLEALDQYDDAEAAITEALRRQPESARAYIKLSEIRQYMNQMEESHMAIDRALELSPQMPKALLRKAALLYHEMKSDESMQYIERARELSPNWAAPLRQKAEVLSSLGQFDEAEKVVNKMLEIDDRSPSPYCILAGFKKFKGPDDPLLVKMLEFEEKIDTWGVQVECSYYFSLAEVYDKFGDYDRAFECLKKGNDAKKKFTSATRAVENHATGVKNTKTIYTKELLEAAKGHGCESERPIFICGMPRSGTTLTEQIISSHPDIAPGGELTFMNKVKEQVTTLRDWDSLKRTGEAYLQLAQDFIGIDDKQRFTDKMPGNFMLIGFIRMVFPNAKIIYCKRNAIDNCLSCYQQNFFMGHYWSYDLEEAAEYYKNHEKMMEHWREVCPGEFLEINYEDTVNDLETQARKLIEYIGLEWNDACLEPHKLKRPVMTASRAQVTKPVYKTSVEKWRKYEQGLKPLVRKLAPELVKPDKAA
jgi:tetratricopeptide (TPR) repeat protein